MKFEEAIEVIFEHEGGYVNDPNDNGGETKYGISKRSYPHEDIKNLTPARAKQIYLRDFWSANKCGYLPSGVNLMFFDMCVNSGGGAAVKALQRAVGAKVDGVFGPKTLAAVRDMEPGLLLKKLILERWEVYYKHADWKHFGGGWSKRLAITAAVAGQHLSGSENPSMNSRIP